MLWTLALPGADIASLPVGSVVASNAVSEELEGFLRAPQASGLFLVDRELQPFHEPLDRRQHVRRRGLAEHTEVIGVVHDLRAKAPGMAPHFPAQYEAPHVEAAGAKLAPLAEFLSVPYAPGSCGA